MIKSTQINIKPQAHLVNIIKNTKDHHPNFVSFLGAGASVTSGVVGAKAMIDVWRKQYYNMHCDKKSSFDEFMAKQYWFETDEEYSVLFETLYDQPSQRREFIESCIKDSSPSWGYIYLVNLIRKKVFNTIFTSNFDDLLNEACYLFSNDVRPLVCAHDSSINSVRVTSHRPKIIKLHGDFLFDNIKNTIRELETLEQNTQEKFKQYATEFGFIVLGYSGNDRSIMDTFNNLLRYDYNFPHGIYWCILKGTTISKKVEALTRFPKFNIVEINSFDAFFAELHNELDIKLQPEMSDPYGALANRLNNLISKIKLPSIDIHPVIEKDIANLGAHIANMSRGTVDRDKMPIPYSLLSDVFNRENNYEKAWKYKLKELKETPSVSGFSDALEIFIKSNDFSQLPQFMQLIENSKGAFEKDIYGIANLVLKLMNHDKLDEAEKILELESKLGKREPEDYNDDINFINRMIIKVKRKEKINEIENSRLEDIYQNNDHDFKMAVNILRGEYSKAEKYLISIISKESPGEISSKKEWTIIKMLLPHTKSKIIHTHFK